MREEEIASLVPRAADRPSDAGSRAPRPADTPPRAPWLAFPDERARAGLVARLLAVVERLAPEDRLLFRLRSFEGLPFREVAGLVGLEGAAAARDRYEVVLERLADGMGEAGPDAATPP